MRLVACVLRGGLRVHVPQVRVARRHRRLLRRLRDAHCLVRQPVGDAVVVPLHLQPVAPVGRLGVGHRAVAHLLRILHGPRGALLRRRRRRRAGVEPLLRDRRRSRVLGGDGGVTRRLGRRRRLRVGRLRHRRHGHRHWCRRLALRQDRLAHLAGGGVHLGGGAARDVGRGDPHRSLLDARGGRRVARYPLVFVVLRHHVARAHRLRSVPYEGLLGVGGDDLSRRLLLGLLLQVDRRLEHRVRVDLDAHVPLHLLLLALLLGDLGLGRGNLLRLGRVGRVLRHRRVLGLLRGGVPLSSGRIVHLPLLDRLGLAVATILLNVVEARLGVVITFVLCGLRLGRRLLVEHLLRRLLLRLRRRLRAHANRRHGGGGRRNGGRRRGGRGRLLG